MTASGETQELVKKVNKLIEKIRAMSTNQGSIYAAMVNAKLPSVFPNVNSKGVVDSACFLLYKVQREETGSLEELQKAEAELEKCFEICMHFEAYASDEWAAADDAKKFAWWHV
jgi:hypothetical protein